MKFHEISKIWNVVFGIFSRKKQFYEIQSQKFQETKFERAGRKRAVLFGHLDDLEELEAFEDLLESNNFTTGFKRQI